MMFQAKKIGLSDSECQDFSFIRAANALANPQDRRAQEAAAFEFDCSRAAQADGRPLSGPGLRIPRDVMEFSTRTVQTSGSAADGGNLVATNLLAGSFIEILRKRLVVRQAGATILSGLVGQVAIPRQNGSTSAYWVAENGTPTASSATFDQVTMSPKTVGAYVDMSRRTLLQTTPSIEALLREDLAKIIGLEVDRAAIHGSGASNQPTGILATAGIGSVAGGTNGAVPTWANIVALESSVSNANADGNTCAYVTNSRARAKLKQTLINPSGTTAEYIWGDKSGELADGTPFAVVNGTKAFCSNQVSNTLTKGTSSGVCSGIVYGDWSSLYVGEWGTLDFLSDPFTNSSAGTVRLRVLFDLDITVRHPESFAAMLDALTT